MVYPASPALPPAYPVGPAATPQARSLGSASDGLFVDFELFVAQPSITVTPVPPVNFSQVPPRSLPLAQPDTYVSPYFEVGYRFAQGHPYLAFYYRFLDCKGQQDLTNSAGVPYSLTSDYRVNLFGLDFGGGTAPPPTDLVRAASQWAFGWRIGVQGVNIAVNSQVQRDSYTASVDNNFWAGGVHGRLELEHRFKFAPGLSIFGRVDGSLLVGEGTRSSQVVFPDASGALQGRDWTYSMTKPAPVLMTILGLSFRPDGLPDLRLSAGYVFEQWWSMGLVTHDQTGIGIGTQGESTSHGLFLQARYDF